MGDLAAPAVVTEPFDEALGGAVLARIEELGVAELAERVSVAAAATGVSFGGDRPFHIDPVPRVFAADEWELLEVGVIQRVLALEAFVADVYGEQKIVQAGVVPARVIDTCDHFDPRVAELPAPPVRIGVAGLDVVRDEDGVLRVLEDNLRTPSGLAYMRAARDSVAHALPRARDRRARWTTLLLPAWTASRSCCSATAPRTPPGSSTGGSRRSWAYRW